jgi:formylglycine-generating enzyme required for sulfatase activity
MRDLIGCTLGHYRITDKIGEGGMGEVFRAHDERLDREVAVKVLPEAVALDKARLARFEREAKAVAALSHSNILEIFDFDTDDSVAYAVTELLEGETLQENLQKSAGPLPLGRVMEIAESVANGLGAAHGQGVIHRDIKPSNIFLCADGRVKILDFGLARDVKASTPHETHSPTLSRYTDPGAVMGTAGYMSPEQARGEPADHRSDIFALGCCLHEMLTGQRAFHGGSAAETMANILKEEPEPIANRRTDVPPKLIETVEKSLRKDATARHQQIDELLDSLEGSRIQYENPRTTLVGWLKKQRKVAALCLVALIVIVASVAVFIRNKRQSVRTAGIISELQPAAEAGRFDEVFMELGRQSVSIGEIKNEVFAEQVAGTLSIDSEPRRAAVSLARVLVDPEPALGDPVGIGHTPVEGHLLVAGEYLVSLTIEGRQPAEFLVNIDPGHSVLVEREFVSAESAEMAKVEAGVSLSGEVVPAFLIDQREVTNEEFFRFVTAGGYREPTFWPETFFVDAESTPRDMAIAKLVDQTGLSGPRFWSNGRYEDGKQDHPVVGVAWYEAVAYARWAGKELPNLDQWWRAAVGDGETVFPWGNDVKTIHLRANFGMRGTQAVGLFPLGMSPFGCLDMAGNVREWVAGTESVGGLRAAVGGSWKEPSYMFGSSFAESYDAGLRSDGIGFRCAKPVAIE